MVVRHFFGLESLLMFIGSLVSYDEISEINFFPRLLNILGSIPVLLPCGLGVLVSV